MSEALSPSLSVYMDSESLKYLRDVLIISFPHVGTTNSSSPSLYVLHHSLARLQNCNKLLLATSYLYINYQLDALIIIYS